MKRRDFITLIGGATVWSVGALAQQAQPKRRIGVLSGFARQDPESNARVVAFRQALADLGWSEERNLQIDYRWTEGDIDRVRALAAELVALAPDVILSEGSLSIGPLLRATRRIPIVFVTLSTLWAADTWRACLDREETPPASINSSIGSVANGWSC